MARPRKTDLRVSPENKVLRIRKLRAEGSTFERIGLELGLSPQTARYHFVHGLQMQANRLERDRARDLKKGLSPER